MKAFIDKIFKNKKLKEEAQIEENKAILSKQIEETLEKVNQELRATQNEATQAVLEAIIKEADKIIVEELKEAEVFTKPGHYFDDCNCVKCVRWRNQNAK
jgi:regulator of protease activity HflC (stomatin/prohibitin superfamily)